MSYHSLIVGSSPLLLIQACYLADKGFKVCVVDKINTFGGSWRSERVNSASIEIACHLIEYIPGVYEILEYYSGVKFRHCDPQPQRLIFGLFTVNYSSRLFAIFTFFRIILSLMYARIGIYFGSYSADEKILKFKQKLQQFCKYQLPFINTDSRLREPSCGYSEFIESLLISAKNRGVTFYHFPVLNANFINELWECNSSHWPYKLTSENIYCSSSASLNKINDFSFESFDSKKISRASIIVEIPPQCILKDITYVSIFGDSNVSRISRLLDSMNSSSFKYLVELKISLKDVDTRKLKKIFLIFVKLGVARQASSIKQIGQHESVTPTYSGQLGGVNLENKFFVLSSYGNLAVGIADWARAHENSFPFLTNERS